MSYIDDVCCVLSIQRLSTILHLADASSLVAIFGFSLYVNFLLIMTSRVAEVVARIV